MLERLLRLVVGIVLVALVVWAGLWAIRLAGFGSLLAVSNESGRRRCVPTSPSRR